MRLQRRLSIRLFLLLTISFLLLAAPFVLAAPMPEMDFSSLSQAMGTVWNIIGALFSFEYVSDSPFIREGILKALVFILLLRVIQVVAKKIPQFSDNKTSTIIGGVVAGITVLFTPNTFIFASVVALIVPLIIVFGIIFAVFKIEWFNKTFFGRLCGLVLMLINMYVLQFCIKMFTSWNQFEPAYMAPFVLKSLGLLFVVVSIAFVIQIFRLFWGGTEENEESMVDNFKRWGDNLDAMRDFNRKVMEPEPRPGAISNLRFQVVPPDGTKPAGVKIMWDPVPTATQYELEYKYNHNGNGNESWRKLGSTTATEHIVRGININREMQVKARARDKHGHNGPWTQTGFAKPESTPTTPPAAAPALVLDVERKKMADALYTALDAIKEALAGLVAVGILDNSGRSTGVTHSLATSPKKAELVKILGKALEGEDNLKAARKIYINEIRKNPNLSSALSTELADVRRLLQDYALVRARFQTQLKRGLRSITP